MQKSLKLVLGWWDHAVAYDPGDMLLPAVEDVTLQKTCHKRYMFLILAISGFIMSFAMLTEVVALYTRVTIVHIGVTGLEGRFNSFFDLATSAWSHACEMQVSINCWNCTLMGGYAESCRAGSAAGLPETTECALVDAYEAKRYGGFW